MSASEYFDQFVIILDKIDKIGVENVKKELIKLGLDVEKINLLDNFLNIKNINDISSLVNQTELGNKGVEELDFILKLIKSLGLKSSELKFDISLARGLDYYTGSIFEVKSLDVNIGSIAGGGRYDDLTSIFGLKDVSGVGISFGIDRIYLVMEELGLFPTDIDTSSKVLFLNFGEIEANYCFKYLNELRENNISSELYPNNDKIKKQMNYANNKGVQFVVMIGEDEMKSGQLTTKNMSTGEQKVMSISEFIKIFQ
jgi:histidyl-tRNA synthetase